MFQKWGGHRDNHLAESETAKLQIFQPLDKHQESRESFGTRQDKRRCMNYLHVLAHGRPQLSNILKASPYHMPSILLDKLKSAQDIQTLVRKHVGVHFESKFKYRMHEKIVQYSTMTNVHLPW